VVEPSLTPVQKKLYREREYRKFVQMQVGKDTRIQQLSVVSAPTPSVYPHVDVRTRKIMPNFRHGTQPCTQCHQRTFRKVGDIFYELQTQTDTKHEALLSLRDMWCRKRYRCQVTPRIGLNHCRWSLSSPSASDAQKKISCDNELILGNATYRQT
jgi:hypothetical protein